MKKLDNTTWEHEAKDDPQDRIEVEIGDSKQDKFFPQTKKKSRTAIYLIFHTFNYG